MISLLDIAPTILAFLGKPGLDGQRGRNLQPLIAGGKAAAAPPLVIQRRYYSEETGGEPGKFRPGDAFSIADGTMKYILWAEGPDELYDLASDPGEFVNLLEKNPEAGADLRAQIEGFVRSIPQRMTKPREMSQEKIDQLRALGYIQ
jgi:arylsulfatase A-like enzyme